MEVLQSTSLVSQVLSSFSFPPPLPDLHSHSTSDDDENEQKKTEKAHGVWWRQEDHFRFKVNQRYIETPVSKQRNPKSM